MSLQKTREYVIEFIVQAIGMPNDLKYIYDDIPEDIINQISISLTGRDIDAETFDPDIAPDVDGFIQWAQEIYEELCKENNICLLYTSPSTPDATQSRMPSCA